ncbi:cytochrome P450 4V2-like [Hyposmocoma kahamanoa]|uniref:cytochrome P450 4V2-like n=1 Tax=Hyposmocoma kahamanoa TaxID=1477025 RepID=UPI000E6D738C|nr:cytochrome P450 4V2-like [Hyposmocoma kahamanoa]
MLCACALVWLQGRRTRKMLGHLPQYPTLPFIGNAHQILGDGGHFFQMLIDITNIMEETDKPFLVWVGPQPVLVLKDLDDIKAVNTAYIDKPYYYKFGQPWVGYGLVTAPSSIWKKNIKKLAGTFTSNIVEGYQDLFNAQAARLVEKLKTEGGEPFDVLDKYLAYTTLESICQTALGVPVTEGGIVTARYYHAFNRTLESLVKRLKNIFYHIDFLYRFSTSHKEMQSSIAILHNVANAIIKTRKKEREELRKNVDLRKETSDNGRTKFKTFLDILLDTNEVDHTLTEKQIMDEVNTIILGGQETAALTSSMALLIIGSNPGIQEKLFAELKAIFGDSKRPMEKDDLQRMDYLDAVICETLRLYPPIPAVARDADKDLQIKSCTIPKGVSCIANIWAAGRSKKQWGSDADQFRPERWLSNGLSTSNAAGLLAFSYGKRSCIGRRYAMSLLKTLLAYIIREFVVESEVEKVQFKIDVTLKPCGGNHIRVRQRD